MGDFSKEPDDQLAHCASKGYVGIRIEQGVPILDRDLNLLHDLVRTAVQELAAGYIGDGGNEKVNGFKIMSLGDGQRANNFLITSDTGTFPAGCMVGGIRVVIGKATAYQDQHLGSLTTPSGSNRNDVVFLDVWTTEADGGADPDLLNADIGMQTSIRIKVNWAVKVKEGSTTPPGPAAGHNHYALATLVRTKDTADITPTMITDLRRTRLNLAAVDDRIAKIEGLLFPSLKAAEEFRPRQASFGNDVEIFGRGLSGPGVRVLFGDKPATDVSVVPDGLKAKVPQLSPPSGGTNVTITVDHAYGSVQSSRTFRVIP